MRLSVEKIVLHLLAFALIACGSLCAQEDAVQQLKAELSKAKHDSVRCKILRELAETASDEEWPHFNEQLKNICEQRLKEEKTGSKEYFFFKKYFAASLSNLGFLAEQKGDVIAAINYDNESIKIQEEINDLQGLAASLNNVAYIYKSQGDIRRALEHYNRAIQILEKLIASGKNNNMKKGLAYALSNIGIIYKEQGDDEEALICYNKSLKINDQIKDKTSAALALNNIGFVFKDRKEFDKALNYFTQSLRLREEAGDRIGVAVSLNNIGYIYEQMNNRKTALEYYLKALKIQEEIADKNKMCLTLNNLSQLYLKQKNASKALMYAQRAVQLSKESGFPAMISDCAKILSDVYMLTGNYKEALKNRELHMRMEDSIFNERTKKAAMKNVLKYEYDKRAAADSVKNLAAAKLQQAEFEAQAAQITQKKTQGYYLISGLVLFFAALLFVIQRFRVTNKQKKIIEEQKIAVDSAFEKLHQKNKEILDSIHYAQRIQWALITNEKYIERKLKESRR